MRLCWWKRFHSTIAETIWADLFGIPLQWKARKWNKAGRAWVYFILRTVLCHQRINSFCLFWRMQKWPIFCRFSWFFFTKLFPSMVAAAREGPLGNHVDQNLTKRFFNGACIFFPLVLCRHCSLHSRRRKGRGKVENGRRNRREKERDSSPCPFRVPLKVKDF